MKTIGLIGGMSWESTAHYYRLINEGVKTSLGGHHSAQLILHSVDFAEIAALQAAGNWDHAGELLAKHAKGLQVAGAEGLVLCTNTMHHVAAAIEQAISIPFLHIADATGAAVQRSGIDTIGLLGTRFTMEMPFYVERLADSFGLRVVVPNQDDRDTVHCVIYDELVHGVIKDESRALYLGIVNRLQQQGAKGVILGCTEIGMLIGPDVLTLPSFDTAALHAQAAVEFALG